jgi:Cdc6-like AAA superfamily ATPase
MNEEKFRRYLDEVTSQLDTTFDKKTIDDMIDALKNRIPKKLDNSISLLDINDIKFLQKIKYRLSKKGDLYEFNRADKTGRPSQSIFRYIDFLQNKNVVEDNNTTVLNSQKCKVKNIILYGSPGVGKTHNTNKLISFIESGESEKEIFKFIKENKNETVDLDEDLKSRTKFVTFHQSFGYEDFIEGFRPNEEGQIKLTNGIFKEISLEAQKNLDNSKLDIQKEPLKNYYLVIDEINRGNISKIFGELITLIEEDKRDIFEVTLPYSKQPFKIPSNLYIIGTMNSTDKSIALIDIALRRRFTFLKMKPNSKLISNQKARDLFERLNEHIKKSNLGEDYQIGHSYFMGIESDDDLEFVREYKIKPLLEEYFYGDNDGLKNILKIFEVNIND